MQTALIALGSNVGDTAESIRQAVELLEGTDGCGQARVSRLFRTTPVGSEAGAPFINAALALETAIEPQRLLDRLHSIEGVLGRVRTVRWGPRVIDLDLIGMGTTTVATPHLRLPHPHCWYRRFVLDPLMDIAPDWPHPSFGRTVTELYNRLLPRPLSVCLQGFRADAAPAIQNRYGELVGIHTADVESDGQPRLAIGTSAPSVFSMPIDSEDAVEMALQMLQAALDVPEPLAED